jgi:hypothetical protein
MQSNMLRFVASDFILRIFRRCMVSIPFELHVLQMHPDDRAGNPTRFGVPDDVVSNFKLLHKSLALVWVWKRRVQARDGSDSVMGRSVINKDRHCRVCQHLGGDTAQ